MKKEEEWNRLISAMQNDIPGFEIKYKDESRLQYLIALVSVWSWTKNDDGSRKYKYLEMTTTTGRTIWFMSREYVESSLPTSTLQHEWVHMKDAKTFFGILPFIPSLINIALFNALYILIFPWPGVFRAYAELRAYRRSMELVDEDLKEEALEYYGGQFTGPNYFFMWPFPNHIKKLLKKPSPYKAMMDEVISEPSSI